MPREPLLTGNTPAAPEDKQLMLAVPAAREVLRGLRPGGVVWYVVLSHAKR
jgi:hypothetical protein